MRAVSFLLALSGSEITGVRLTHMAESHGGAAPVTQGIWYDAGYTATVTRNGRIEFNGVRDGRTGWFLARFDPKMFAGYGLNDAKELLKVPSEPGLGGVGLWPDYSNPRNRPVTPTFIT
ncbi:MAG TPA: hypothetical protein VMI31_04185, partial [Fimbriimonadaceae bacterium]|nr:hypothetical protein [Fimbriimonadaceae bacterium]